MKKIVSFILSVVMLVSLCTFVLASPTYDVSKAMEYAASHVNDNDGSQCAEFVSKCVQAGGLNIPTKTGTKGCWDAILDASGLSGTNLTLNEKGYAIKSNNENILARGDVVVQWCYTCNLRPHILICGGYDSEGYATFYAHNDALENKKYNFSKNSQHEASCNIGAKVVQLSKLNSNESSGSTSTPDNNMMTNNTSSKQKCGEEVYWEVDNGVLTISGTGEMYDYKNGMFYDAVSSIQELQQLQTSINSIVISDGVTSIGEYAFLHLRNVKRVRLPKSIMHIKEFAFFYVGDLEEVIYAGSQNDWEKIQIDDVDTCNTSSKLEKVISYEVLSSNDTADVMKNEVSYANVSENDYKINVKYANKVVATATMSASGSIKEIQGDKNAHNYFRPLITNVDGVTCIDVPTEKAIFEYENGTLNSVSGEGKTTYKTIVNENCSFIDIYDDTTIFDIQCNENNLVTRASNQNGQKVWNYDENKRLVTFIPYSPYVYYRYYYDENGFLDYCIAEPREPGWPSQRYDFVNVVEEGEVESTNIKILLDNKFLKCDQSPVMVNDRTLVPMRAIFEALGATVSWEDSTSTATGVKDGKTVSFTIDKSAITIDGVEKELDVAAQLINDRTMIPVRAVAEAFDCSVNWIGAKEFVVIIPRNQKPYKVVATEVAGAGGKNNLTIDATAQFNDRGLLTNLDGSGDYTGWFAPFTANINGNTYVDQKWIKTDGGYIRMHGKLPSTNFYYDENGVMTGGENCTYKYEDGLFVGDTYTTDTYSSKRTLYYNEDFSECIIKQIPRDAPKDATYTFNEMGLIEKHNFVFAGITNMERVFEYNDRGMVTEFNGISFEYDENDKLISASNGYKTVNYKYIYE